MKALLKHAGLLILTLVAACSAYAQISPGKLSRFHEKLEGLTSCTSCHELRREVSNARCLTCHTALAQRVEAGVGFHGSAGVRNRNCRDCHSEHNGRDFELVHWEGGRESFPHGATGFELRGTHARQGCGACHRSEFVSAETLDGDANVNLTRTFLGLKRECLHCHDNEHRGQLAEDCARCHGFEAWSPAPGFSHDYARFALTGKHVSATCDKCHHSVPADAASASKIRKKANAGTYARYAGLEFSGCNACHQDPHAGRFGPACGDCHTTEGFAASTVASFDHAKTAFPLEGAHARVACRRCHTSGRMTDPLKHERCVDCHRDYHQGRFSQREDRGACESCHTVAHFSPSTFDAESHSRTRYPLSGGHLAVPCVACHRMELRKGEKITQFDFADTRCQTCHADAHQGQLDHWVKPKGCEFCHSTETWHRTSFDHGLARFSLEGRHREILCLACHRVVQAETGQQTLWMKPLTMECAGCHRDVHAGQFVPQDSGTTSANCGRCHTPQGWRALKFDHKTDARFALDGAHAALACSQCHRAESADSLAVVRFRPLAHECRDCHSSGR